MDALYKSSSGSVGMDPMMVVPVMASVTKTVGFGVSASTSYENPFVLARRMSTLDHLNNGRIAWNVVTSWAKSSANALGVDSVVCIVTGGPQYVIDHF